MTRQREIQLFLIIAVVVALGAWWLSSNQVKAPTVSNNANQPTETSLKLAYIAIGDDGQRGPAIGCGDSVIFETVSQPIIGSTVADRVSAAVKRLLIDRRAILNAPAERNALVNSKLMLDTVTVADGTTTVALSGQFQLDGECDNPRVQAQLEQTVKNNGADQIHIQVNGRPLNEVLSLK